jgi:U3 small nucleolar RNA-associated protein 23
VCSTLTNVTSSFVSVDARRACKKFAVHHCGHEESVSASECLLDQVREGNHEHFFVATQDRNLQQKISNKPAGAVMFATVNGIQMEMPSEKQKHHVSKSAEEKLLPGILEIQNNMVSSSSRSQNQFKRRKAKGPNPLSMKKKKGEGATIPDTTTAEGAPAKKAKRMRKSRALIQEQTT